jgi:hypothetical protein
MSWSLSCSSLFGFGYFRRFSSRNGVSFTAVFHCVSAAARCIGCSDGGGCFGVSHKDRGVDPRPALCARSWRLGEGRIGGIEFAASRRWSSHLRAWRDLTNREVPDDPVRLGCIFEPVRRSEIRTRIPSKIWVTSRSIGSANRSALSG